MNTLSAGELLRMYRLMVRIREFEQKVTELFMEGLVPGPIQPSNRPSDPCTGFRQSSGTPRWPRSLTIAG